MISFPTLVLAASLLGQSSDVSETEQTPVQAFKTMVLEVAEKDSILASDYQAIAEQTLAIGSQAKDAGTPLEDSVIHDGLDAVEVGRELSPLATDWEALESALIELLEKPEPPPEQEQQQDQQQQDQENQEQQNQDQQGQQGENGEQSDQQQENQDSQSEQQNQEQSGDGQKQDQENQQSGEEGESQENGEQQSQQQKGGSKIGDLSEQEESEAAQLDKPEASGQESMQSVGGGKQAAQKVDADKAIIMQKLEQLKQQDDPAKLFQILQEAEAGEKTEQKPNGQDW